MEKNIPRAFVAGVERVTAWADLLDQINVFPVADGDTGRNLVISLSALRHLDENPENIIRKLMFSACGNSGNIAARFFSGFLTLNSLADLSQATRLGREYAWKAIGDPKPGTMLTVYDALVEILEVDQPLNAKYVFEIIDHLEKAVNETPYMLPKLRAAEVVDSGALGMFIYFEGFFQCLIDHNDMFRPVTDRFKGKLRISASFREEAGAGHCVDMIVHSDENSEIVAQQLSEFGESVIAISDKDYLKIHLHTQDKDTLKKKVDSFAQIVSWSDKNLRDQIEKFIPQKNQKHLHIMTDAAGSLTRQDAQRLGVTLLDSYILTRGNSLPETFVNPSDLYRSMRQGEKVTTSQASVFERHQYYQSVLSRYDRVLYLCVGSVYTGNYDVATAWKKENDPDHRFTVIDTGAASGRLAVLVMATAKYAFRTDGPEAVVRFARTVLEQSQEYIFLDRLQYLAASGRLSKTGAFFCDLLHVNPVVTPTAEGVKKVGSVRSQESQIKFVLEKLTQAHKREKISFIMLEYSDNRQWVEETIQGEIRRHFPSSEIIVQPLSLTSGVHMGPGTWGVAVLPNSVYPL
ncbi:MAG: DegV family protein [Deltaproteobacteria bacterium]|nr:DegV family protein [Deltaproteobacteria bacterium]